MYFGILFTANEIVLISKALLLIFEAVSLYEYTNALPSSSGLFSFFFRINHFFQSHLNAEILCFVPCDRVHAVVPISFGIVFEPVGSSVPQLVFFTCFTYKCIFLLFLSLACCDIDPCVHCSALF